MYGKGNIYVAGRPVLITDGNIRKNWENNFETLDSNNEVVPCKGAIIGIVLGVVEAIAIVIILVYFLVIRPRKLREPSDKADNISNTKNENDISTGL